MASNEKGVWLLQRHYNEYDQHGGYPVVIWENKPTVQELAPYVVGLPTDDMGAALAEVLRVLDGGTRKDTEHDWVELTFVRFGENIEGDDT